MCVCVRACVCMCVCVFVCVCVRACMRGTCIYWAVQLNAQGNGEYIR